MGIYRDGETPRLLAGSTRMPILKAGANWITSQISLHRGRNLRTDVKVALGRACEDAGVSEASIGQREQAGDFLF